MNGQKQKVHVKIETRQDHLVGHGHEDTGGAVGEDAECGRVGDGTLWCRHDVLMLCVRLPVFDERECVCVCACVGLSTMRLCVSWGEG